jgi:iron complex transport system substrate-binding protein
VRRRQFLAAAAFVGCGKAPASDPARALRIVSTSPSMTEAVFALGRGAALVGRSSFCDYPEEAKTIEAVGGFADPNVERIVALAPTLVTGERGPAGPELSARLESLGIATYFPVIDRVSDIERAIRELARKIDAERVADEVAGGLASKIASIADRVRAEKRPRVVFLFDFKPLIAAGPESFPADALVLAGAENAVTTGSKYPTLSAEGLLALDPDVIIDGSAGAYPEKADALLRAITGLADLRALREGRVVRLEGSAALRPGPRIAAGIQQIAEIAHPRAFQ